MGAFPLPSNTRIGGLPGGRPVSFQRVAATTVSRRYRSLVTPVRLASTTYSRESRGAQGASFAVPTGLLQPQGPLTAAAASTRNTRKRMQAAATAATPYRTQTSRSSVCKNVSGGPTDPRCCPATTVKRQAAPQPRTPAPRSECCYCCCCCGL